MRYQQESVAANPHTEQRSGGKSLRPLPRSRLAGTFNSQYLGNGASQKKTPKDFSLQIFETQRFPAVQYIISQQLPAYPG